MGLQRILLLYYTSGICHSSSVMYSANQPSYDFIPGVYHAWHDMAFLWRLSGGIKRNMTRRVYHLSVVIATIKSNASRVYHQLKLRPLFLRPSKVRLRC
jgi:hypothetical protein